MDAIQAGSATWSRRSSVDGNSSTHVEPGASGIVSPLRVTNVVTSPRGSALPPAGDHLAVAEHVRLALADHVDLGRRVARGVDDVARHDLHHLDHDVRRLHLRRRRERVGHGPVRAQPRVVLLVPRPVDVGVAGERQVDAVAACPSARAPSLYVNDGVRARRPQLRRGSTGRGGGEQVVRRHPVRVAVYACGASPRRCP